MEKDLINHPPHYTSHPSGVECIEITEHFNFNLGNAIKYIWRSGLKDNSDTLTDLKKAEFYIKREILRVNSMLVNFVCTSCQREVPIPKAIADQVTLTPFKCVDCCK